MITNVTRILRRCVVPAITIIAFFLWLSSAFGEINMNDEFELGEPIVAESTEDATIFLWDLDSEGAASIEVNGSKTLHIWAVPSKDAYKLRLTAIRIDFENKKVEYSRSYKTFKVIGEVPPDPPDPPDPPNPDAKYRIMMFYNGDKLDDMPKEQREILTSLTFRQELVKRGHNLLEILNTNNLSINDVPEKYKPWLQSIEGDPLPRFALAPLTDAGPIYDYELPNTTALFFELLEK